MDFISVSNVIALFVLKKISGYYPIELVAEVAMDHPIVLLKDERIHGNNANLIDLAVEIIGIFSSWDADSEEPALLRERLEPYYGQI